MRPIFVLGNPRSGTTMLRLMLTCHRNILIPPEAGFAVWLHQRYNRWLRDSPDQLDGFVSDLLKTRKIETWELNESELKGFLREAGPSSYPEAVSLVYQWYGRCSGRSFNRWGDKNNFYIDHIDVLDRMFPDAQFVHIVRDGRNVACSYRNLAKRTIHSAYAPRLPVEIESIADEWKRNTSTVHQAFQKLGSNRSYEMRLEDLVCDPQKELMALTDFLGEEFDPRMLEYHRLNSGRKLEPEEFLQWKEKTLQPPITTRNEIYKSQLEVEAIATFEAIAGDALRRYGYLRR